MIDKHAVFLVVNDFEPVRQITSGQLRSMGANTILTASNGAKALHILQNQRVDIVLSDWNMHDMTGLELLKAVRSDEKLSRLPFIMIIYEAERQRIKEAIASGVSDLLVNPYTTARLASRVEKALAYRPPRPNSPVRVAKAAKPSIVVGSIVQHAKEQARPTILIVDDIEDNLLLLSDLFKDDYRVRIAPTGEKALGICQSDDPPDLVLLDIMMPKMDGFEVAQRMRAHPISEAIPVIFVTAMIGDDVHLKCLELGAVDFVTRPIDPDVFKPRVHNFMHYVELHKQLQAEYDDMLALARLRENIGLITLDDMTGPLGASILTVVRDYIAYLEGSNTGPVSTAISQLIVQLENADGPDAADTSDKRLNIPDDVDEQHSGLKKSWLNSKLLNASDNTSEDPSIIEIPLAQLRPGMEIESVYIGSKPYVKHCIANEQIINFIYTLNENTGNTPTISIRLSV